VDVLRGLTVSGMVLVNNPGSWAHVYGPLRHAEWHGFTPTDTIFPFFLFIVGVAIPLALGPRREGGARGLAVRVLRRGAVIFALGLLLQALPWFHLATVRIPGVLQWRVDRARAAGIVDEQHPGDRHASKHIQRQQALAGGARRRRGRGCVSRDGGVPPLWRQCGRTHGLTPFPIRAGHP